MAYQSITGAMDKPVAPEQVGGWSTPFVFHCQNLQWTVATRRGSTILRVEKLSQDQVREFDANKEVLRLR